MGFILEIFKDWLAGWKASFRAFDTLSFSLIMGEIDNG